MISNSILPIPLPDGIYCGTWRGFYVTISSDQEVTQFKVDKALRNRDFPCIVTIENKKAVIDSGNPLVNQSLVVIEPSLLYDKNEPDHYTTLRVQFLRDLLENELITQGQMTAIQNYLYLKAKQ